MYPKPTNGINTDYQASVGAAIDGLNRRLKGNLLDNGAFQIWQHGTSIAAAASVAFGPDRWAFYRSGLATGATVSRQTGSQARYCARVQRDNGNASTAFVALTQSLETASSIPTRSRSVTLAFRARMGANFSSASAALAVQVFSGTGTDESLPTAYTGQATLSSTSVTLTSSMQDFAVTLTPGASANEIAVSFQFTPVGTAGAADYFEIEEVQLVRGDYAGEFPYRSDAEELTACLRFFEKTYDQAVTPGSSVVPGVVNGTAFLTSFATGAQFKAVKRAVPTVTIYNRNGVTGKVAQSSTGGTIGTSVTAQSVGQGGFQAVTDSGAGFTVGVVYEYHFTASAEI